MKTIRIGGGQGFWGDINDAAIHMIKKGNLNYLSCDYLAELTLSIMQRQRIKNPQAGYAKDFITLFREIAEESYEKGIKVLSNAGGMNVWGAVKELEAVAKEKGLQGLKIGYVLGDDLREQLPQLLAEGIEFKNMDHGGSFEEIKDKILNANVYYGHQPLKQCLDMGADVVVTGRASDSSLFLAPLAYEFGWEEDDWDHIARGIIVGHLLECGGQGSGGNFDYGWRHVPNMDELGYPIAEVSSDGIVITKAPDCGGLVSEQSCKEQLLYEIHDPANYITPDVVADISKTTLTGLGEDRVGVANITGKPRPDQLKLSIGYLAGYKVETYLPFAWPDAHEKARYAADIIMKRMKKKGLQAEEVRIDYLGLNALHGSVANLTPEMVSNMNEVVLRIAIRTKDKREAYKIVPEIAPLQLNGPPGSCFFGGRATVNEVIGLWPTLVPRDLVKLSAHVLEVK